MSSARPERLPRQALALLSLAMVGACASYEPAPIDLDRLPQAYAARGLDEPGLRDFVAAFSDQPQATWPPSACDLTQLQAIALFHRPELRTARAQLQQTEAEHAVAAQLPNPKLGVGPGLVANPGDASRWLLNLGLTFPLELFGTRDARAEAAASTVAAARLGLASADQHIRAEVVERAFLVQQQQQLEALAQRQVQLRQQTQRLVERRAAAGAADAGEVATARAAAQRAIAAVAAAARAAAASRTALAAALGLPAAALADLQLALPPAEVPALDDAARQQLAATAVRQRLDVAEALCGYARSEAELRLEVARQWPDFELGPGYEYDQGLHKFRFDLGFTLPLFHGNGAAIAQATAARVAAAAAVEAAQTHAITEIEAALQQCADQRRELAAARELAATTAAAVASAQRRAALGADDAAAAIAAHLDDVDARLQLAQLEHATRLLWLRLEQALQQPVGPGLLAWQHAVPETQP